MTENRRLRRELAEAHERIASLQTINIKLLDIIQAQPEAECAVDPAVRTQHSPTTRENAIPEFLTREGTQP